MYSFTTAKPKHIFSRIVKIWWFYIFISLAIMITFILNLNFEIKNYTNNQQRMIQQQTFYEDQINKIAQDIERLQFEINVVKNSSIDNLVMESAIANLLNLIPDQITISLIEIQKDSLIIQGNVPSKEVFRYLLQDPLKAIFGESHVNFYMLSNGGYEFVSKSKVDQLLLQTEH